MYLQKVIRLPGSEVRRKISNTEVSCYKYFGISWTDQQEVVSVLMCSDVSDTCKVSCDFSLDGLLPAKSREMPSDTY